MNEHILSNSVERSSHIQHVVVAILYENNHVLLCQRPEGKPLAGYFEFPGGKVKPNETSEQALQRELFEELGITVTDQLLIDSVETTYQQHGEYLVEFYCVQSWDGLVVNTEHSSIEWVLPENILSMPILEGNKQFIPTLLLFLTRLKST